MMSNKAKPNSYIPSPQRNMTRGNAMALAHTQVCSLDGLHNQEGGTASATASEPTSLPKALRFWEDSHPTG